MMSSNLVDCTTGKSAVAAISPLVPWLLWDYCNGCRFFSLGHSAALIFAL
jgi:hypothetical protein